MLQLALAPCSFSPASTAFTATRQSLVSIKLLEATKVVGDYGFDPLGLSTEETAVPFREAELKHGRLAMLAAVAWPLQEIFHPILVDAMRASGWKNTFDMMAETDGKSPSLLNGGLEQWETAPALMLAIFLASVLELGDLKARQADGLAWNEYRKSKQPGDFSFDPLNIARSLPPAEQREFQEKELLNGRLAMIAVTSYVAIEFAFDVPVVRFTPDLFRPLILAPDFRAFMDTAFTAASMDGSIDGIAY
eukprot:CAMPEP_0183333486 /NCGR_PEP_ID=MMETSP0164_2-20130417/2368_1 /TAXON_ID=221442 /ORGANISM="Coccolithus pelagicus ssp braarudi, Strain PLY182g" /LENGTH=248 /DNA_ID=CAMNT_0025502419 /DNA_START=47 /DNA_END=793 /DNA_ORIENTATION=-